METVFNQALKVKRQAALDFGQMIRRWRKLNGWTQYVAKDWGVEAGIKDEIDFGNMSETERGTVKNPQAQFFLRLSNFNQLVHEQQFKGVHTRKLLDRLKGSRAICDEEGVPWDFEKFLLCYHGCLQPPSWLSEPSEDSTPVLSQNQAAQLCNDWANQARAIARQAGAGPTQLMAASKKATRGNIKKWQAVLMGLDVYTPDELAKLWDPVASEWEPMHWLNEWRESLIDSVVEIDS